MSVGYDPFAFKINKNGKTHEKIKYIRGQRIP